MQRYERSPDVVASVRSKYTRVSGLPQNYQPYSQRVTGILEVGGEPEGSIGGTSGAFSINRLIPCSRYVSPGASSSADSLVLEHATGLGLPVETNGEVARR